MFLIASCILVGVIFSAHADLLLQQKVNLLEVKVKSLQEQLEYGGKRYRSITYSSEELRDHDYLRLQFLGAHNGWLGCPNSVCALHMCPSGNNRYQNFGECGGEVFQIIADGNTFGSVKSGQRIRLRLVALANSWVSCIGQTKCDLNTCPGTLLDARDFNRCQGEVFAIHARGKKHGATINSGDVIMLVYHGRYITIQGKDEGDATSLDTCPGIAPPAFLSYGICSNNVFRVYRKPTAP